MSKITVTIDTDLHKVVPIDPTQESIQTGKDERMNCFSNPMLSVEAALTRIYKAMLANVPDTLPGVVQHSGESCAYIDSMTLSRISNELNGNKEIQCSLRRAELVLDSDVALFTHPPAQPDTEALKARIAELKRFERMFMAACDDLGLINEALDLDPNDGGAEPILDAIEELNAQIAAQAGQDTSDNRAAFEAYAKQEFSEYFEDDGESMFDRAKSNDYKNLLLRNALGPFQAGAEWQAARASPPVPANFLAIVQAALEAAATCADEWAMEYVDHDHAPYTVGAKLRSIDPQTIIDAATKG